MRVNCFCVAAALALSGCGGRVHGSQGSGATTDAGSGTGSSAGAGAGSSGKHCTFKGFAPAVSYPPLNEPLWLTAIDTGAGSIDLVVGERGQSVDDFGCEVFANDGHGTFTSQPSLGSSDNFCGNLVSADFNGDGKPDLASQLNPNYDSDAESGVLNVDFGTGPRQFASAVTPYPMPFSNSELVVGDFDADGHPDIAAEGFDYELPPLRGLGLPAPEPTNFALAVLLSVGTRAPSGPAVYATTHLTSQLKVADFDGDGRLDLAGLSATPRFGFDVYLNAGDGTFRDPLTFPGTDDIWFSYGLASADFNGDGKADLATTAVLNGNLPSEQNVLQIFNGRGDGSFDEAVNYVIANTPTPYQVVTGDFNGDHQPDLVMVISRDTQGEPIDPIPVSVFLNQGDGTFGAATNYYVGNALTGYPDALAVGDLNGDGVTDIAVTTETEVPPYGTALNVLLSQCE